MKAQAPLSKLNASEKSMILAIPCKNLRAGSFGCEDTRRSSGPSQCKAGELKRTGKDDDILEKAGEPPPRLRRHEKVQRPSQCKAGEQSELAGAPKGRFSTAKSLERGALVIVDMQNDFMPGGALGVPAADELIPVINALIAKFDLVVATQDWHPADHVSFASNHPGKEVGDVVSAGDIEQILWPAHCVRNMHGAELAPSIDKDNFASFFYKGTDKNIDSYSAFFDNARRKSTGLGDYLKSRGITDVYLAGVATDYCILYSAMDAVDLGFHVYVIADACRPINLDPRDEERSFEAMAAKGAKIVNSSSV